MKKSFSYQLGFSNRTINYLKTIVVSALFISLVYINITRPRIIVVHSYAEDFSWVTDFNTAFRNSLKHSSNPIVYYSYMNTLNRQTTLYKNRAGQETMRMINTIKPKIIVSVFTDANEYAIQNYLNHPTMQIVYNMKSDPARLKFDTALNTQGIKAGPALKDLNDILLLASPKRPIRIAHVGDQASSVRLYDKYLVGFKWNNIIFEDSVLVNTFDDWKKAIKILSEKVDFIILSKYFALTPANSKTLVPTKEVMKWTMANSKVPVIGLYTAVVEEGGDFAVEDSPFEQGSTMATMVKTLLDGNTVTPKMQTTHHFVGLLNERAKIKLPEVYGSFSTALRHYKKK